MTAAPNIITSPGDCAHPLLLELGLQGLYIRSTCSVGVKVDLDSQYARDRGYNPESTFYDYTDNAPTARRRGPCPMCKAPVGEPCHPPPGEVNMLDDIRYRFSHRVRPVILLEEEKVR